MEGEARIPVEVPAGDPNQIRLRAVLPHLTPDEAFAFWTRPERLIRWWPARASVHPGRSGSYHFEWPHQGWHLRGEYRAFDRGRELAFSWRWDHDPGVLKEVRVSFETWGRGTVVTVQHGPYTASAHDAELRESHLDGWKHFLTRLAEERGGRPAGAGPSRPSPL